MISGAYCPNNQIYGWTHGEKNIFQITTGNTTQKGFNLPTVELSKHDEMLIYMTKPKGVSGFYEKISHL